MRLIARLPDQTQVGSLVDSLRNAGFDRKDMVITDLAEEPFEDREEVLDEVPLLETERESNRPGEMGALAQGIEGLKGRRGIAVAVEMPKHSANRVRQIMEQSGAAEIIQD